VLAVTTYFNGQPRTLWLINAGYQLVAIVLMGAIHGVWDQALRVDRLGPPRATTH
jgi:hypothetical protein